MDRRKVLALSVTMLGATSGAMAAERQATLQGAELMVSTPCARSVSIAPDPALRGEIRVLATADHQEELDRLTFETSRGARIGHAGPECWVPIPSSSFSPTLLLAMRVPVGFAITIEEGGVARYSVGDIGGSMKLDLSGSAEVKAASAAPLHVDLSGSGTVEVQRVGSAAAIDLSGHGQVDLGQVSLTTLESELSGAGAITVGSGQIGAATLNVSGAGAIAVDAETANAGVSVSGLGTVRFAKVTGTLKKDVSGMGSVTIGPK